MDKFHSKFTVVSPENYLPQPQVVRDPKVEMLGMKEAELNKLLSLAPKDL